MTQDNIKDLIRYFRGNPGILRAAQSKDASAMTQVLKAAGVSRVTQKDLQAAYDLASAFDDDATIESRQEAAEAKDKAKRIQNAEEYGKAVRTIAMQDPKIMAIYAALQTVASGAKAAGDISQNNANKMAEAILSLNRTNSNRQNEVFGPSKRENAAGAWAANKQRKGNNGAILGHFIGDSMEKILGTYRAEDLAARQRAMAPYDDVYMPGMSGQRYQTQWQREKSAMNMGK